MYSNAHFYRGILKYKKNDLKGALDDFNQAVHFNPEQSDAYFYRGEIKDKLNDVLGALYDFNLTPKELRLIIIEALLNTKNLKTGKKQ